MKRLLCPLRRRLNNPKLFEYFEVADFEQWLEGVLPQKEALTIKDQRNEYLMLHLRLLVDGLDLDEFEKKFGLQKEEFYINLNRRISSGELIQTNRKIRLTDLGVVMANNVISDLFV